MLDQPTIHGKTLEELREMSLEFSIQLSNTPNETPLDLHERFKIKMALWIIIEDIGELVMKETKQPPQ